MTLIEIFSDYVYNRKSLLEYIEVRKSTQERGEFNDLKLIRAQEHLDRLKNEDNDLYELMYKTLNNYKDLDMGHTVEYPIDFIREILKMYEGSMSTQQICENYQAGLRHSANLVSHRE